MTFMNHLANYCNEAKRLKALKAKAVLKEAIAKIESYDEND